MKLKNCTDRIRPIKFHEGLLKVYCVFYKPLKLTNVKFLRQLNCLTKPQHNSRTEPDLLVAQWLELCPCVQNNSDFIPIGKAVILIMVECYVHFWIPSSAVGPSRINLSVEKLAVKLQNKSGICYRNEFASYWEFLEYAMRVCILGSDEISWLFTGNT